MRILKPLQTVQSYRPTPQKTYNVTHRVYDITNYSATRWCATIGIDQQRTHVVIINFAAICSD